MFLEKTITLCLTMALFCNAEGVTVGEALPCREYSDDNLSCIRGDTSVPIEDVCYNRSALCNGKWDCAFGEDEGLTLVNALDCIGQFGPPKMFRCNDGSAVELSALCDGHNNCSSGSDETSALCADKCRLPFYGNCSYTRQCVSSELSVNCGACLPGFVEVNKIDCLSSITVGFEATMYDTSENNSSVEVCAILVSGNITDSFQIEFSASPDSDSDGGEDYSFTAESRTFSEGTRRQCVMINITDDNIIEPLESFTVQLAAFQPNIRLDPQQAIVIIADNDVLITVGIEASTYNTSENDLSVEVCANLVSGNIIDSFQIEFSASPDSASDGGVDYSFTAVNQTFDASTIARRQCVMINIADDELTESRESFTVQLAAFQPNIRLDPQQATVFIADNDDGEDSGTRSMSTGKSTSTSGTSRSGSKSKSSRSGSKSESSRSSSKS